MSKLSEPSTALCASGGPGPPFFRFRALAGTAGLRHAISCRLGGGGHDSFGEGNVSFRETEPMEQTLAHREALAAATDIPLDRWVTCRQVHGATVTRVTREHCGRGARDPDSRLPAADGLVTADAGVALAVFGADCGLVLLWCPEKPAIGVAHAGWRGLAAGVLCRVVEELCALASVEPTGIHAALAPAIRACCYVVGPEVKEALSSGPGELATAFLMREGRLSLDIEEASVRQLVSAGLGRDQVIRTGVCTACRRDLFYSARGDGEPTGRCVLVVMMEEPQKGDTAHPPSGPSR